MSIVKLLNGLRDLIPFTQNENLSFLENVSDQQELYLEKLKGIDEDDLNRLFKGMEGKLTKRKLINRVNKIYEQLKKVILYSYEGFPPSAYKEFRKLLMNKSFITDLNEGCYSNYLDYFFLEDPLPVNFYRLRSVKLGEAKTQEKMFHPPFEKRSGLGNYRFSIPGYPCLYLGRSLKICSIEVNPTKTPIYVSLFKVNINILDNKTQQNTTKHNTIQLLNLTRPEKFEADKIFSTPFQKWRAVSFLLTFPLIQICLYRVKDSCSNAKFKHEYIIPQLLLQLILQLFKQKKGWFNSIIYTSTKITTDMKDEEAHNLVFPTFTSADSGYCPELISKTQLTVPIEINNITFDELQKAEQKLQGMPATALRTKNVIH